MAKGGRGGRRAEQNVTREHGGDLDPSRILKTEDMISKREGNRSEVDESLTVMMRAFQDYGFDENDLQVATIQRQGSSLVMGYYDGANVAINKELFNSAKMNEVYDLSVADDRYHPSRGNKSGMEAVVSHEVGHALTDKVAKKMGLSGISALSEAADRVVNEARKLTKHRGVVQMANKISRYATTSNAETVAEAFSDVYCNGKKAAAESRAIVNVMNKYLKH